MSEKISAEYLLTNARYGLQRAYSVLNKTGLDGVSQSDIDDNYDNLSYADIPFAQYMSQNISQFDSDSNGVISEQEMTNKLNELDQGGYTYEQLLALQGNSTYGLEEANESISKLLEHFKEIDKNSDGKITTSEIKSYNLEEEITDKEDKYKAFKASDLSIFYADDTTETTADEETSDEKDNES